MSQLTESEEREVGNDKHERIINGVKYELVSPRTDNCRLTSEIFVTWYNSASWIGVFGLRRFGYYEQ